MSEIPTGARQISSKPKSTNIGPKSYQPWAREKLSRRVRNPTKVTIGSRKSKHLLNKFRSIEIE